MDETLDPTVSTYIAGIAAVHRPLFDRLHRLITDTYPDATPRLSYQMPLYQVGTHRLFVGVWKNWVSLYGWDQGRDSFAARHPELQARKGTLQIRPAQGAAISDDDFLELIHDAFGD